MANALDSVKKKKKAKQILKEQFDSCVKDDTFAQKLAAKKCQRWRL